MTPAIGKPILVVGASGTIGTAVARFLCSAGHVVGLHYCRNRAAVDSMLGAWDGAAPAYPLQSNLTSALECEDLVERFASQAGGVFGVALCSGRVPWKPWQDADVEDWGAAYFEHCIAPFMVARAAAKRMSEGARIAFLSSIAAKYGGSAKTMHYAAAKSGLEAAMRGLARELAPRGILVNGVRSGFVDTPQQRIGRTTEELVARVRRIPLGRGGMPEEVASAMVYLMSSGASFMTGEIITIAGGD